MTKNITHLTAACLGLMVSALHSEPAPANNAGIIAHGGLVAAKKVLQLIGFSPSSTLPDPFQDNLSFTADSALRAVAGSLSSVGVDARIARVAPADIKLGMTAVILREPGDWIILSRFVNESLAVVSSGRALYFLPDRECERIFPSSFDCVLVSKSSRPSGALPIFDRAVDFRPKANRGEIIESSFSFTNFGSAPLEVSELHGSCSCVAIQDFAKVVEPGGRGLIHASVDTRNKRDSYAETVLCATNSVVNPTFTLGITGELFDDIEVRPLSLQLNQLRVGSESTRSVYIRYPKGIPHPIPVVSLSGTALAYELGPVENDQQEVYIHVHPNELGMLHETFRISVSDKVYRGNVYANVVGNCEAVPAALFLPPQPDETVERDIVFSGANINRCEFIAYPSSGPVKILRTEQKRDGSIDVRIAVSRIDFKESAKCGVIARIRGSDKIEVDAPIFLRGEK